VTSVVTMRRSKRATGQSVRILVRLTPEQAAAFRQIAEARARTPANLLRLLALRYLEMNAKVNGND
jgi:hypothetical protein